MAVTGMNFANIQLFKGSMGEFDWLKKDVIIGLIVFSVILVILLVAGFCILNRSENASNLLLGIYGGSLFFFVFIPLLG